MNKIFKVQIPTICVTSYFVIMIMMMMVFTEKGGGGWSRVSWTISGRLCYHTTPISDHILRIPNIHASCFIQIYQLQRPYIAMCKLLKSALHPSKQKWHGGIERKYLFGKNALQTEARCASVQPPPSSTTTANIYFFPTKPPIIPSPRYLQLVKLSFAHRKVNVYVSIQILTNTNKTKK